MNQSEKFLGKGIVFPIELENGSAVVKSGFELIRSSVSILLTWPKFSRWMLYEYGDRANELLENPLDLITTEIMRTYVINSITEWEKRISLISAEFSVTNGTKATLTLKYEIVSTKEIDTFVFPFYEEIIY